jgi:5-methylcytosine-specific restriction enzyme subunit McrC
MERWLADILKNGTLKDNQLYESSIEQFKNVYNDDEFSIKSTKNKRKAIKNEILWSFLIESEKRLKKGGVVTRFNEKQYEQNTSDPLFELKGSNWNNFSLQTGNLVGSIVKGNCVLKISSRFGDSFLKYIIADADGFLEIQNFGGINTSGDLNWLLAFLWKTKLKKAFRLGLPKDYKSYTEKTSKIRGKIDPVDYFLNKKSGKYLCNYREHSYQTDAATLITEVMRLPHPANFLDEIQAIVQSFKSVNAGQRSSMTELKGVKPFKNPFYNDYNKVIELSKLMLFNQSLDFGKDGETSAFLFDVSMLFEYFVKKLLMRSGLNVLSKFSESIKVPTGAKERELQPDILVEDNDGLYVFDVKYKRFDTVYGVKREDVFQLHTYVGQFSNHQTIKGCGFIYPTNGENKVIRKEIEVMGNKIPFHIYLIGVPQDKGLQSENKEVDNFNFAEEFNKNCQLFVNEFTQLKQ